MKRIIHISKGSILSILFSLTITSISVAQQDNIQEDKLIEINSIYDDDYIPDANYEEIEDRLQCIESEIPLHFNETVKSFINYFTIKNREYTRDVIKNSAWFFPIFEQQLKAYNLPDELKYLSIVESGLRQRARSRAAAVGLWQFISSTGRYYGLHQDWYIDERMDAYKATDAACRHLKSLYTMFGDWELALAAYNCGAGNVRKAMRRSGYKKTFWEIYPYLPRETRSYVPQFVAVAYSFKYAEENNFLFDEWEFKNPIAWDTIHVDGFVNVRSIAEQLNVCFDELEMLNPEIKHGALPEGVKNYALRIPIEKHAELLAYRSIILDSASQTGKEQVDYLARNTVGSTWGRDKVIYRVQSGDVLGKIAERYHVRVSDLRNWNNLNGNLIRVGQRLDIWLTSNQLASTHQKPSPQKEAQQTVTVISGSKYHIVQDGDTLWDIARLYEGLSIEKLKKLNNLKSNKIKPGQKLVIG